MDYTKPINIVAVNNTAVKYSNVLKGLNMMMVQDILKDCTPIIDVQDSIVLGKTEHGTISKKYSGTFTGDKTFGTIVPRTLTVHPIVAEMADEPERYRKSFVADVASGLWDKKHPFELWLLQYGINIAGEDLYFALMPSKFEDGTTIQKSFDGWFNILDNDVTEGRIAAIKGNYYVSDAITTANAGDLLLEQWRGAHKALRNRESIMWISEDVGDLYDDWYRDEHDNPPMVDQAGQMYLEGTNKRCRLKRCAGFPEASQRVLLTTRQNMVYGTGKLQDLKGMKAFESGNPYLFTAAMKYVFGTQFVSVHERELVVNSLPGSPLASGSASF